MSLFLIATVKKWLEKKHVYVSEKWMRECIQFFNDQNTDLTMDELKDNVYQKWLLADLDQIRCSVFPSYYDNLYEYTLKGTFAVQMNYFYKTSSCSRLIQLLGRENLHEDPLECIILVLTDGCKILSAVELYTKVFKPIYPPGTKILLKGPIECKLETLILKPENFTILGGEAEEKIGIYDPKLFLSRMKAKYHIEDESEDQTNNDENNSLDHESYDFDTDSVYDEITEKLAELDKMGKKLLKSASMTSTLISEASKILQENCDIDISDYI